LKKAKTKKRMQFTTLKIITGNEKNIMSYRYPKKMPKILLACALIFTMLVLAITYGSVILSKHYQVKLDNIKSLESINNRQQGEIDTLNLITAEVKEKLKSLETIETKVKEIVGIED